MASNTDCVCRVQGDCLPTVCRSMTDEVLKIRVRRLEHASGLPLPSGASSGSSGLDLRACIDSPVEIGPGESALVPTGFCLEIPPGYEGQVRPRSGLALEQCVTVLNSPGTVDSDYRGEVGVILVNHGPKSFTVCRGDRIAQIVFCRVCTPLLEESDDLGHTARGGGGFGHSGV
jgi:dUTP pyrophosphatase